MQNSAFNPFEFLTTPWGPLPLGNAAGAFNPTDVREIDKRIQELKAVEQWLSLNLNLLKTTIQGLEVQRGTLAAIQAFSDSFATAATGTGSSKPTSSRPGDPNAMAAASAAAMAAAAPGMAQATQWWDTMQKQFEHMMLAAQASTAGMMPTATTSDQKTKTDAGAASGGAPAHKNP